MKYSIAASSLAAATLAVASPQMGGGNRGNPTGDNTNMINGDNSNWNGAPSCVSSCWQDLRGDSSDYSDFCTGDKLNTLNSCIADSDCDQSDKDATYQVIAQGCANAGQTVTASPQATFSATSGGSAWPSAWTSNSAYASALSSWQTQTTGAPAPFGAWGPGSNNSNSGPGGRGGWNGGNGVGPFGAGGPGNGWGPWSSRTSGDWTAGPWTSWWGGSDCPGSTWSGWTSDGTEAPWTAWSGCAASTTASSVVTTTVTTGSTTGVQTSTSYGIRVAAASMDASATTSSGSSTGSEGAGARPTAMAGSALAAVGVLGAALLL